MAMVLRGRVVTFDPARPVIDAGAVYVGDDGRLAAVAAASEGPPQGFATAPQIDTGGVIYPGLIDLHSHIAYNTLPLWEGPSSPYLHHDTWTKERKPPDYSTSVSWPAAVLQQAAAEALIKYVEVKALIGGTTAIQGAPRATRSVDGWLVRIVDVENLPAGQDVVLTAVIQKEVDALLNDAKKLRAGQVMLYHVAEGKPDTIVHREFTDLDSAQCLHPGLIGIHATALTRADFKQWQKRVKAVDPKQRATMVWSPFSNLWLYHQTTDVVSADLEGVRIALGSDWSPSGTKHLLGELKVADSLNRNQLQRHFSDQELCEMVTANPGDAMAVAWGPQVGRLKAGMLADVVVCARHDPDPYRNLIEATERHVRLVLVRGRPFYGTPALMKAAGAGPANSLTVAGQKRAVVVRMPGKADATLDWPGVKRALEKVRKDPVKAWNDSADALASWGGPLDDPEAPLALFGDMPEGDIGLMAADRQPPADLEVPKLDPLAHDATFFKAVKRAGPPPLHDLESYYR